MENPDLLDETDGKKAVAPDAREKIMDFLETLTDVFNQKGKTLAHFVMPDGSEWIWSKKPIMERALDKKAENILKE